MSIINFYFLTCLQKWKKKKIYLNIHLFGIKPMKFLKILNALECVDFLYTPIVSKKEWGDIMSSTITCSNCRRLVCHAYRYYSNYSYYYGTCKPDNAVRDYFKKYPGRCGHSFLAPFLKSLRLKQLGFHASFPALDRLPESIQECVCEF